MAEQTVELQIRGLDCAECAAGLERALAGLPSVRTATVLLGAEKAIISAEGSPDMAAVERILEAEGCSIARTAPPNDRESALRSRSAFGRSVLVLLGLVVLSIVVVTVIGELLGVFELMERSVPWPIGWAIVLAGGFPVFREVVRAALRRQVTSGTLMTLGAVAATIAGQWPVGMVVMFFMRVSDYVERFTGERGRQALRDLVALAPQNALVERDDGEQQVALADVRPGDVVVVRPGGKIPVDGVVVGGRATVDQASITGESMPVDVAEGDRVFAATVATGGSLRVRTERVGSGSTFGRVIRMVEEAELHRANVQRLADRVAGWYLPVVVALAVVTFLVSRNLSSVVAVLVVACACSFALATPIAILASVGAAAGRGLLIKGGRYLEALARADAVLIDKTGTLTMGRPRVTDIVDLDGLGEDGVLALAASAERYSEHPLAEAVRTRARERALPLQRPDDFEALPGAGVRSRISGSTVVVGSRRLVCGDQELMAGRELEAEGKTLLAVMRDERLVGMLAAADTLRPEIPEALQALRELGVRHLELLTGDNERVAATVAGQLGVEYRANLLPEDKIAVVRELQAAGRTVVMIGDGVNDAPALAQADVGIAMGAAGSDVAIEAAHIALMRDDWRLVPDAFAIARRTMRVVKLNLGFTIAYNLLGLALAATGVLPPVLAAAAQSLPDFGIVGNSARLLRLGDHRRPPASA
jgi:Cu+-exporting ATPase